VSEGESVGAGAALVTVAMTSGRGGGSEGVAGQLAELARQDAELARQQGLAFSLGATETGALHQQKASLAATIASLERQLALGTSQIALAEADTRRTARLAGEGAGTQRQVEEARAALLARRLDLEGVTERLIAQRETLRAIDGQVAARRIGAFQSSSEIAARRAVLAEQRAALSRQDRLVLTAPVAGTVGDIGARVGLRAQADASLVTIIPGGSDLEVQLWAPSRAIGFVQPGQPVRLLFDAFPYQKHGAGRGTVTAVASVPTEPAALDPGLGITEPVFRVRVRVDARPTGGAAADRPLRAGMTLAANLVLERRSLWEVFLDPVLKAMRS
jgi:membrane fusion protein